MSKRVSHYLKIILVMLTVLFVASAFYTALTSRSASGASDSPGEEGRVQRISPDELKNMLDRGETVLIVDVRSEKAYNQRRITGALSVPVSDVEARLSAVPTETHIVFY